MHTLISLPLLLVLHHLFLFNLFLQLWRHFFLLVVLPQQLKITSKIKWTLSVHQQDHELLYTFLLLIFLCHCWPSRSKFQKTLRYSCTLTCCSLSRSLHCSSNCLLRISFCIKNCFSSRVIRACTTGLEIPKGIPVRTETLEGPKC